MTLDALRKIYGTLVELENATARDMEAVVIYTHIMRVREIAERLLFRREGEKMKAVKGSQHERTDSPR